MARKKVFVSFDYDNDETLKTFLIGQSKHEDTPFDIWDSSVKAHLTGDWEAKVKRKIQDCDIVCVLCGLNTHKAVGVGIELQIAKDVGKDYFLLAGYKDAKNTKPSTATSADKMYNWTWENLKNLIHGGR